MGATEGKHFPACHSKVVQGSVRKFLIEMLVCVLLDRMAGLIEKREVFDKLRRFIEIDQNTDLAALGRFVNRSQKPH